MKQRDIAALSVGDVDRFVHVHNRDPLGCLRKLWETAHEENRPAVWASVKLGCLLSDVYL